VVALETGHDAPLKVATVTGVECDEQGAALGDVGVFEEEIPHGVFVGVERGSRALSL
jgi:hypothetical protein